MSLRDDLEQLMMDRGWTYTPRAELTDGRVKNAGWRKGRLYVATILRAIEHEMLNEDRETQESAS